MLQDHSLTEVGQAAGAVEQQVDFFERVAFSPIIDLPLVVACLVGMILYFRKWAHKHNSETNLDLPGLLPRAYFRVCLVFSALVLFFYVTNIAVWFPSVIVLLVVGSLTGDLFSIHILFIVVLRETCFGLPSLIHDGVLKTDVESEAIQNEPRETLIGQSGRTVSPLRPSGYICVDGEELPAVSDTGELIDSDSSVVVTRIRNGQLCVRSEVI